MGVPNITLVSFFQGHKQAKNIHIGADVLAILRGYLVGAETLPTCFAKNIEAFFALRIEAFHWLSANRIAIDYDAISTTLDMHNLPAFAENKMLQVLQENVGFALRVYKRLLKNLPTETTNALESGDVAEFLPIGIGYRQFLALIEINSPQNAVQETEKTLSISLGLEAGLLCVMLLEQENLQVSEAKLCELCAWIADKAQSLGALFRKTEPKEQKTHLKNNIQLSNIALQEDKMLSEQGMVEYANSLQNA